MTLHGVARSPAKPSGSGSKRWRTLDVFRGLAILSMIQGHTFTALLRPSEYGASWLPWYTLLHGLTAPMFLLGGGLAYGLVRLSTSRAEVFGRASPRIIRRACMLVALGYALQLPKAPLGELWLRRELLEGSVKVGPLQLVGLCLLLLEGLRALTSNRRRFLATLSLATLTICGAAPFVWQLRASSGPLLPVTTWLDGYAGSLFPFFPWSVFFFAGALLSAATTKTRDSERKRRKSAALMLLCALLASASVYLMFLHGYVLRSFYGDHELWHTSPLYVVFRAGIAVACVAGLWILEPALHRGFQRFSWIEPVFGTLSRQSLVAYVVHLLILYGTPFTTGLVKLGATLSLLEASLTFGFVLCLTTAIAVLWDHFVTSGRLRRKLRSGFGPMSVGSAQVDGIGER